MKEDLVSREKSVYDFIMSTASYLSRFLQPVANAFTEESARQFAEIQADEELQEYVKDLARKANDGTITPEEDAEYKAIVDAADMVGILRLKAKRYLKQHAP